MNRMSRTRRVIISSYDFLASWSRLLNADQKADDQKVRQRLARIMCWHVNRHDAALSDSALAAAAINRHRKHRGLPLIDPAE